MLRLDSPSNFVLCMTIYLRRRLPLPKEPAMLLGLFAKPLVSSETDAEEGSVQRPHPADRDEHRRRVQIASRRHAGICGHLRFFGTRLPC